MAGEARARETSDASSPSATDSDKRVTWWSSRTVRRIAARAVLGVAVLLSALALSLLIAGFINDGAVTKSRGEAVAEVLDTSPVRTVVRFSDDRGRVYIPNTGVLYPAGLQEGQLVRVEYWTENPDLVRVAGRSVGVAVLPVLSAVAGVWVVLGPVWWFLRRSSRERS